MGTAGALHGTHTCKCAPAELRPRTIHDCVPATPPHTRFAFMVEPGYWRTQVPMTYPSAVVQTGQTVLHQRKSLAALVTCLAACSLFPVL